MRRARFDVYEDVAGEWRWRLYAANGRTIADSGEGYGRKQDAQRAVRVMTKAVTHIGNQAHNACPCQVGDERLNVVIHDVGP